MSFEDRRRDMVDAHLKARGIGDERVLRAMGEVPREQFVESGFEQYAYDDGPLPIGAGQTISQPYIVALMTEAAQIAPRDKVLEVGTGSGYAAAVMSRVADAVLAIEWHESLGWRARERFSRLGYDNIDLRVADGSLGWPEAAPFDAILVAAAGPAAPCALKQQLAIGGRLIVPVGGSGRVQRLVRLTREAEDRFAQDDLGAVRFVPLIGEQGWA